MRRIVVTTLWRLRPPFPEREFALFRHRKTHCFSGGPYCFYRISSMDPLFSPTGDGGQNVTQNGGPQIGACLILSDFFHLRAMFSTLSLLLLLLLLLLPPLLLTKDPHLLTRTL